MDGLYQEASEVQIFTRGQKKQLVGHMNLENNMNFTKELGLQHMHLGGFITDEELAQYNLDPLPCNTKYNKAFALAAAATLMEVAGNKAAMVAWTIAQKGPKAWRTEMAKHCK